MSAEFYCIGTAGAGEVQSALFFVDASKDCDDICAVVTGGVAHRAKLTGIGNFDLSGDESDSADLSCAVHKAARLESGYLAAKLRKLSVLGLDLGREGRRALVKLRDIAELHRRRCRLHDALIVFYMLEHAEAGDGG